MTDFEELLERAKAGDKEAQEAIFRMYRPLLIKNAMEQNVFEEDSGFLGDCAGDCCVSGIPCV